MELQRSTDPLGLAGAAGRARAPGSCGHDVLEGPGGRATPLELRGRGASNVSSCTKVVYHELTSIAYYEYYSTRNLEATPNTFNTLRT